jgi:molybdenum cofactor synthesis domain-containing protein
VSTVSIIIIGDEILSGKFRDENTPWLIDRCKQLNLTVQSIRIIPDDLEIIARSVSEESTSSRYVFTTGGVGPTHDDMTFAGVAKAFNVKLVRNKRLEELIVSWFGELASADTWKMAEIPECAILIENTDRTPPQIVVNNVYIFPGVPKLLQRKFKSIENHFVGGESFHSKLSFNVRESRIATDLRLIQENHPQVDIGSYPRFDEEISLIITVEAATQSDVDMVSKIILEQFQDFVVGNSSS